MDRLYPYQERAREQLHAMQGTNTDARILDLNVIWPDGKQGRCAAVANTVDDYSGYPLAFRFDRTENSDQYRLLSAEVFENYGVPERMTFDNTMAAANKMLSGGTKHRFRFKFKRDEIMGIFPRLDIDVHFAKPRHGQSKSVERVQCELIDYVEKDPRLAGAYLGSDPTRKPANYGEKAVPIELVIQVYAEAVEFVRSRTDRKTRVCNGRSRREVFEESIKAYPVRKLTRAQLRYLLLAATGVKADKDNGSIRLGQKPYIHRYWSETLLPYRGQKPAVRFDPDKLENPIIVETLDGVVIDDTVPCLERAGVYDTAAARKFHHAKGQFKKATKELEKAQQKMSVAELQFHLPPPPAPAPLPEAKIIAPAFESKRPVPPVAPARDRQADFEAAVFMLEEKRWGKAS
ncbi:MAG: transposase domain-containing protein [Rhodospirillaceae bacterium]